MTTERKPLEPVGFYDTEQDGGEWSGIEHRVSSTRQWETDVPLFTGPTIREALDRMVAQFSFHSYAGPTARAIVLRELGMEEKPRG